MATVSIANSSFSGPSLPWWHGWTPLVALPTAVVLFGTPTLPGWALMWSLAFALFAGAKWLTWRRTPISTSLGRHFGYLFAWPGLDAAAFLDGSRVPPRPVGSEWCFAAIKTLMGLLVLAVITPEASGLPAYVAGWVGMIGIALLLHFGLFHLLSCAWRRGGVDARPLMHWPLTATGVAEYWGRRWNTAFRDLTYRFWFRPLTMRFGPRIGLLAGFLFSGIVHDLVISLPAGGGYGQPTLFFLLQAGAIQAERSPLGRRLGLGRGLRGWVFTMASLGLPLVLLFHPAFVHAVVVPFLHVVGAPE